MNIKLKEKDVQHQIIDYLKIKKVFFWRNNSGAFKRDNHFYRFGDTGSPDLFAIKNGKIYGLEVKGSAGRQSESQKEWQINFEKAGGVYVLAYNLEEIIKKI